MKWYTPMSLAIHFATMSEDKSTQNGAVIVDRNGMIAAADYNRLPRGVYNREDRLKRPMKYLYMEHAERGAIYQAARSGFHTNGATMVCPWAACADCARAIIQSGIKRLVRLESMTNIIDRWETSVEAGDLMMREAGVEVLDASFESTFGVEIRRNGELLSY